MFGKKVMTMVGKKRTIEQEVVVDRRLRIRFFSFKKKSVTSFFISRTFFFYIFFYSVVTLWYSFYFVILYICANEKMVFLF